MHFEDHESIFQTILVMEQVFNAILVENHRDLVPIVFPCFLLSNLEKTDIQEKKQKNTFFRFSC